MTGMILPIALAATIILRPGFDPADALQQIKEHRPTLFPGSPNMYLALANFPGVRGYGVDSIKACLSGSEPLPVEVQEQFEKLTRGRVVEGYGLTEASPVTHVNPISDRRRTGSIGLPLPSTEARIVDLKSGRQEVEPGHLGELEVRGPQVMLGYWKDPEETGRALDEKGWLRTGDVAMMEEDGYFRIVARKADMWIPEQGEDPAFPRDVEEVLYEVPTVKEAAVVPIARQPVAFVIPRGAAPDAAELIEYCRRRLPPALVPKLIVFVDDFPRTFIGKILRRELARRFEEQQASQ
jgi:long-chain acyl-CoA synthetase